MEQEEKHLNYYAHSKKNEPDRTHWQLLSDHLTNTADLAEIFGVDAGMSELARTAAMLHDIGKYSKAFQDHLAGSNIKVDHSTAGARTVLEIFNNNEVEKWIAIMIAYCIAGHHSGLPDYGSEMDVDTDSTLMSRIDPQKKKLNDFSQFQTKIKREDLHLPSRLNIRLHDSHHQGFTLAFFIRMLYSILVDADFQETEEFMDGKKPRGLFKKIDDLDQILDLFLRKFETPENKINQKRTEILNTCISKAKEKQGFFTLTVPTGGGKTLASMAFGLKHAATHGLKRIIYVIPFTSIIEQNAAVFKEILGEENVLEHHSNFDWNQSKFDSSLEEMSDDILDKLKLASENWDIPIVVTTNVQFFESLFANRSSRCRKLHNLAKSVIIFDEAQMLPREYLDPCMFAVKELVINYGSSAVFCTATQPCLGSRLPGVEFTELAPDPQVLFDFFRRIRITDVGTLPDPDLIKRLNSHPQVLCIVNTRKHAKGLFEQLEGDGCFHVSTLMCPAHRKRTLIEIKQRLLNRQTCRVVSTQVMEAGIDVDFPVGYRSMAGLDSIIQAAGRVNREGKNELGDVYIFESETPFIKKTPTFIKQGSSVAESILRQYPDDSVSIPAINAFYTQLYTLQDPKSGFDAKRILSYFEKGSNELDFDFKSAAENFNMIENKTVAVVIPFNEPALDILKKVRGHPFPFRFARQLQPYTVNIYQNEFEALQSKGGIETYNGIYEVLTNMDYYNDHTGLTLVESKGGEALFFD